MGRHEGAEAWEDKFFDDGFWDLEEISKMLDF